MESGTNVPPRRLHNRRWIGVASCLASISLPVGLVAQASPADRVIHGRVFGKSGVPVTGVEVLNQTGPARATTDSSGRFTMGGLPPAVVWLLLRRPGYGPRTVIVDLRSRLTADTTIELPEDAFVLPTIEVTSRFGKPSRYAGTSKYDGFFERRKRGLGTFLTDEDIERRNAHRTAEILEVVPGARVSLYPPGVLGSSVSFARCDELPPKVAVFVDGIQLIPEGGFSSGYAGFRAMPKEVKDKMRATVVEMLDRVDPRSIAMVEVYRGVAQIPPEFQNDNCAAIVIWTK